MAMNSEFSGSPGHRADDKPSATDLSSTSDALDADLDSSAPVSDGDDPCAMEVVQECLDLDVQNRLWLKAVVPLLQLRTQEPDSGTVPVAGSGRVQFALDLMYIAACERIARILRSDLNSDQG
jgi:hypothetical protein